MYVIYIEIGIYIYIYIIQHAYVIQCNRIFFFPWKYYTHAYKFRVWALYLFLCYKFFNVSEIRSVCLFFFVSPLSLFLLVSLLICFDPHVCAPPRKRWSGVLFMKKRGFMVAKWRGVWMDLEGVCLCVSGWGCVCVFSYCVGGRVGFFFFRVVYVYYIPPDSASGVQVCWVRYLYI